MSFQDIEIVTLSSASTADASFEKALRGLDLNVDGHIPKNVNISGGHTSSSPTERETDP